MNPHPRGQFCIADEYGFDDRHTAALVLGSIFAACPRGMFLRAGVDRQFSKNAFASPRPLWHSRRCQRLDESQLVASRFSARARIHLCAGLRYGSHADFWWHNHTNHFLLVRLRPCFRRLSRDCAQRVKTEGIQFFPTDHRTFGDANSGRLLGALARTVVDGVICYHKFSLPCRTPAKIHCRLFH